MQVICRVELAVGHDAKRVLGTSVQVYWVVGE